MAILAGAVKKGGPEIAFFRTTKITYFQDHQKSGRFSGP